MPTRAVQWLMTRLAQVHHALAARVAKQGGLTGILFDPEPYNEPW